MRNAIATALVLAAVSAEGGARASAAQAFAPLALPRAGFRHRGAAAPTATCKNGRAAGGWPQTAARPLPRRTLRARLDDGDGAADYYGETAYTISWDGHDAQVVEDFRCTTKEVRCPWARAAAACRFSFWWVRCGPVVAPLFFRGANGAWAHI